MIVRPARPRVLQALEHHDAGALGRHEAVAVHVERAAGALGVVVAARQRPRGVQAGHAEGRDARPRCPPAIITSAAPRRMIAAASPMPWLPEAHAVTTHELGPRRPSCIETWPADMLTIVIGIHQRRARGRGRARAARGGWSSKVSLRAVAGGDHRAGALAVAVDRQVRVLERPAAAAATANWLARSMRRAERRSR